MDVGFLSFCNQTCLSGHDNIADVAKRPPSDKTSRGKVYIRERLKVIRFLRRVFGTRYVPPVDEAEEPVSAPAAVCLPVKGSISTDTASLVVFDLSALSHRVEDECDWWADPKEELVELAARNVLIVGLGSDGLYDIEIRDQCLPNAKVFSLRAPSGTIFVGPGEEISGGGNEPDGRWGGHLISVPTGDYSVSADWQDDVIKICLIASPPFENEVAEPVRI